MLERDAVLRCRQADVALLEQLLPSCLQVHFFDLRLAVDFISELKFERD